MNNKMSDFEERKLQAIALAGNYQQYYYEMLPDWFEYGPEDYTFIKQKIGYAIFGPPQIDRAAEAQFNLATASSGDQKDNLLFNRVVYDTRMCKVIDLIYKQIIQYGGKAQDKIYIGIIYNVLFLHTAPRKAAKGAKEAEDLTNGLCLMPVIKLRKEDYPECYIDNNGRVYKSWADYVQNNTLPKCTMILPKCGLYQSNPEYKVAECYSTVWLEVIDSPACSIKRKVLQSIDVGANAVSICTALGLGIASLVTPIGPVAVTAGLVHSGISGSWIIARGSQKLVDLAMHRQSICPTNRNAFSAWFGIGSSAFAMGATGGTALLSQVGKYTTFGSAARVAYNSMMIGNLAVNGISVAYQSYCLIEKYKSTCEVDLRDIVMFASHVLFFGNALINVKLAGELIEMSKGTIFERFKNALRFNRFAAEFYKAKRGGRSGDGMIYTIRNIVNKEDFLESVGSIGRGTKSFIKYSGGKIIVNDRTFLDPVIFSGHLLTAGTVPVELLDPNATGRSDVMIRLKVLLVNLMKEYFGSQDEFSSYKQSPNLEEFNDILQEMKLTDNAVEVLTKVFKIAFKLVQNCDDPKELLHDALYFTWNYCKANLKEYGVTMNSLNRSSSLNTLTKIVTFLLECIDEINYELFSALYTFIRNKNMESSLYTSAEC